MEYELVREYIEHERRKGRAAATTTEHAAVLGQYVNYLEARGASSFFAATAESVTGYIQSLRERGACPKNQARKLRIVYQFYEWLRLTGRLLLNPATRPRCRGSLALPRHLPSMDTLQAAYAALRTSPHLWEQRDYVLVDLAYACGLRRCELHRLNLDDIRLDEGFVRVRGKRGSERLVPMGPRTRTDLQRYLYHVRPRFISGGDTRALFLSWRAGGKRMHLYSINAVFARLRRTHKLDQPFAPHALRHAFATHLVREGAAVQDVSEMLGHVKLETTQVYTHLVAQDLRRCHAAHHPRP